MVEPHTASTNQPQKETQARRQTEKEKGTMEHEETKVEENIRINDIEKAEAKKEVENLATNAEDEEGDSDPEIRELEGECFKIT